MIYHRQALCQRLQHNCSPCEECNTRVLLMVRKRHHKVMEYVCNATRRLGDGQRVILRQRVRGSVRAVRAVRNTRVFLTEIRVVADETNCHLSPVIHLLRSNSCHPPPVIHPYPVAINNCRDPSPAVIHLMTGSIWCHPSLAGIHLRPQCIAGRDESPGMICLRAGCISGRDPSRAGINLRLWSSWFQPFISTLCVIVLIWAAFHDFSYSSVSSLKVIVTGIYNIHLSLTNHRSPIIHPVTYRPLSDNTHSLICPYGRGSSSPNPNA